MNRCPKTITLFTFIGTEEHEDDSLTALRVSYERFYFNEVVCVAHALTDNIKKQLFSSNCNIEDLKKHDGPTYFDGFGVR